MEFIELRRIVTERSTLLAAEQERANRLRELSTLKADFTAMVAHELGNPLASIQGHTDMLKTGEAPPDLRDRALDAIQAETDALKALVADVRAAASVEREDFAVEKRLVELDELLKNAECFAKAYDNGEHPLRVVRVEAEVHGRVLADGERVGQVLRNLLSNAAKYSGSGSPVELRVLPANGSGRVRIEVVDHGRGIRREDAERILEVRARAGREGPRDGAGPVPEPAHRAGARLGAYGGVEARRRGGLRLRAGGGRRPVSAVV